jgi:DNA-binding transcriptional ArsR family regulator
MNSVIISLRISKALADATRLRIIATTYHINCSAIAVTRAVTPATVSHHLKILSEAGLIACRRGRISFKDHCLRFYRILPAILSIDKFSVSATKDSKEGVRILGFSYINPGKHRAI